MSVGATGTIPPDIPSGSLEVVSSLPARNSVADVGSGAMTIFSETTFSGGSIAGGRAARMIVNPKGSP
jgi:hypothetical protein